MAGIEYLAVNPARPDADVIVHPLVAQHLRHRFGRSHQSVATPIETSQDRLDHRLQKGEIIIARIGFEPRVHGCQNRYLVFARPRHHLVADTVRTGNLHDIGIEPLEILADIAGKARREAIFTTTGKSHGRDADKIAGRLKSGRVRGG